MIGLSYQFIKYGYDSVAGEVGNTNLSHINSNQRYSENIMFDNIFLKEVNHYLYYCNIKKSSKIILTL